jgi:hypothetical protein
LRINLFRAWVVALLVLLSTQVVGAQSPVPANGSFTTNLAGWNGNGWSWTNQGYVGGGANGEGDKDFSAPIFTLSSSSYLLFWLLSRENDPQRLTVKINGETVRTFIMESSDGWREYLVDLTSAVGIGTVQLAFDANGKKFTLDEVIVHAGSSGGGVGGGGVGSSDAMLLRIAENAPLTAGAVWAVLILLVFVLLTRPKQRMLQVLDCMFLATLPLAIVNAGIWAITLYVFVLLYHIIASMFRLIE